MMLTRRRDRLSYRLLFWILVFSSFFTLVTTSLQLYLDYRDDRSRLDQMMSQASASVLPTLAAATWTLDTRMIEITIGGLLTQDHLRYADLRSDSGELFYRQGDAEVKHQVELSYPVVYEGEEGRFELGRLHLVASLADIYRQLWDRALVILLSQGVKTFLMSICILLLVDRLIIRHLNTLGRWAETMNLDRLDAPLRLNRPSGADDAIEQVVGSINRMRLGIRQALEERQRAEAEKIASDRLVQTVINHTSSVISIKDREGRYLLVNNHFLSLFRMSQQQVLGRTDAELFPRAATQPLRDNDRQVMETGTAITFEEQAWLRGTEHHYISVKFPFYGQDGRLDGVSCVSTDITQIKRHEQEITRLNEVLERKVTARTQALETTLADLKRTQGRMLEREKMAALGQLVAGVAHEVNTPLGIGVTVTSVLKETVQELRDAFVDQALSRSKMDHFLTTLDEGTRLLESNLDRAANLINNFKQVAADQSSEQARRFRLHAYLTSVVASMAPVLRGKDVAVELRCDPGLEVCASPGDFAQILSNFIANSVAHGFIHTPHPWIEIAVFPLPDQGLRLFYRDNGDGIEPGTEKVIFEPFYTTARNKGGTGLGMSIVYNLVVQKLGGDICCRQGREGGVEFEITLPGLVAAGESPS